jgi:hypothetical protein
MLESNSRRIIEQCRCHKPAAIAHTIVIDTSEAKRALRGHRALRNTGLADSLKK